MTKYSNQTDYLYFSQYGRRDLIKFDGIVIVVLFTIGNDLFVEDISRDQLMVFDIGGWNLKYSIPKVSVWDVHKDFVLSKT